MLFTSPIGYLTTHCLCTVVKEQNTPGPFCVRRTQRPLAHSLADPGASSHKHQQEKNTGFPTSLRTPAFARNAVFKFVNAQLEKNPPGFFLCYPPTVLSRSLLGAGGIFLQAEDGWGVLPL